MTTPRIAGRLLGTLLVGVCALTFGFATAAAAASPYRAPRPSSSALATPTSKADVKSVTITGPGLRKPLTFRQDKQNAQYTVILSEVTWMDGRTGDVIETTDVDLGPDYTVTLLTNGKATVTYDLFPQVHGGPRAHRQATSDSPEAWFFAPVDMASKLALLGVRIPVGSMTGASAFTQPAVPTTAPASHLSDLARQSRIALALAVLAAIVILFLLAYVARRSRDEDRRTAGPSALARLAAARARAGRVAAPRTTTPRTTAPRAPAPPARRSAAPHPPSTRAPKPTVATARGVGVARVPVATEPAIGRARIPGVPSPGTGTQRAARPGLDNTIPRSEAADAPIVVEAPVADEYGHEVGTSPVPDDPARPEPTLGELTRREAMTDRMSPAGPEAVTPEPRVDRMPSQRQSMDPVRSDRASADPID